MSVTRFTVLFELLYFTFILSYEDSQLYYECDSKGIIHVQNPDPEVYVWARANASDYNCRTTVSQDPATITIYNCFDRELTLLLSNENKWPTIIKKVHKSYTLSCTGIPEEGVVKKVVDGSHVTVIIPTIAAPPRYPSIPLDSTLVDPETGEAMISAVIGEPFDWVINAPAGYKIKPSECTSSGGDNSIYSLDTHTEGCTLDGGLMSDFKFGEETQTSIVTTVHTFRFPDTDQLKLFCNMLVCHNTSDACNFNCSKERRKRSDEGLNIITETTNYPSHKFTVSTKHRSAPTKWRRRRTSDERGSVGASITVIGEPNISVPGYGLGSCPTSVSSPGTLLLFVSFAYFYPYMANRRIFLLT